MVYSIFSNFSEFLVLLLVWLSIADHDWLIFLIDLQRLIDQRVLIVNTSFQEYSQKEPKRSLPPD